MRSNYKKLGSFIKQSKLKNDDGRITRLLGVNLDKEFMPSVANLNGVDLTSYKVILRGQFGCKLMSVGRDGKVPISRLVNYDEAIISSAYFVFEVKDETVLNPEYLMMWFSRSESDRFQWFQSGGDIRGRITWEDFGNLPIKVPAIEIQQKIVKEYQTITRRINLNERLNQKLEETAQALYKHWFVDFEFPFDFAQDKPDLKGKPYKSSGGAMVYNEELDGEIPEGWENCTLNDIASYSNNRVKVDDLNLTNYISTENMLANRKGIVGATSLPQSNMVTRFKDGDVLISNIRPYFKKIWKATHSGGCSNDILCFVANNIEEDVFLYYLLEQDIFFDYVMSGSKGTKMPRGDKEWIMNYAIAKPPIALINHFTKYVSLILKKIRTNILQNKILNQTQTLLLSKMTTVGSEEEIVKIL